MSTISAQAASAREAARDGRGRFGEQRHAEPGQLGLVDAGPREPTSAAYAYFSGDDIAPDAMVYAVVGTDRWDVVDPDEVAGDPGSWLGPADRLANQLEPGEYDVYGVDRSGRTAQFTVVVGSAPSAGDVAAGLGDAGDELTMPDGSRLRLCGVQDMGPAVRPGEFRVGVDTDEALFLFDARPGGGLVPAGVKEFHRQPDRAEQIRVSAFADDLAGRFVFHADVDGLTDRGRDATLAQWQVEDVARWSSDPAGDVASCLRGRQQLARRALENRSPAGDRTVGNYVEAAVDARLLGHPWEESNSQLREAIETEWTRRGR